MRGGVGTGSAIAISDSASPLFLVASPVRVLTPWIGGVAGLGCVQVEIEERIEEGLEERIG
jgi:hypothetical protein